MHLSCPDEICSSFPVDLADGTAVPLCVLCYTVPTCPQASSDADMGNNQRTAVGWLGLGDVIRDPRQGTEKFELLFYVPVSRALAIRASLLRPVSHQQDVLIQTQNQIPGWEVVVHL